MISEFRGQYDWATNFYHKAPFYVHGQKFKTSEHYFAACKTLDANWCQRIIGADTAADAKRLGRQCPCQPEWGRVRVNVMSQAIWYKFTQHPELQEKLIATGTQVMVEGNWWHDNFWGDCYCNDKDGRHPECLQPGKDALGLLLMNLRTYFQTIQMISK